MGVLVISLLDQLGIDCVTSSGVEAGSGTSAEGSTCGSACKAVVSSTTGSAGGSIVTSAAASQLVISTASHAFESAGLSFSETPAGGADTGVVCKFCFPGFV